MADQCRSYVTGGICRDGFPTSGACKGDRCIMCGTWVAERNIPSCQREDLGPHLIDDAGMPRLAHWRRRAP